MTRRYLTVDEIVYLHRQLMLESGHAAVLMAPGKLESALRDRPPKRSAKSSFPASQRRRRRCCRARHRPRLHGWQQAHRPHGDDRLPPLNRIAHVPDQDPPYNLVIRVAKGQLHEVEEIAPSIARLFAIDG